MTPPDREQRYRALMGRLATGVTVVACGAPERPQAMTANSVTSVSLEPPLLLVCVRNRSRWLPRLLEHGRFSVNVLGAGQRDVSRRYAGQCATDDEPDWRSDEGVPVLADASAAFTCRVQATHAAGDHTIVVGLVERMHGAGDASALVFLQGRYHPLGLAA